MTKIETPQSSRPVVLVVDDDPDLRMLANMQLGEGFDVIQAADGEECVARALDSQPDVILLDMMMPGMDGAATIVALLADAETAHIPVVFLTAKAMASEVQRLKELGAKGVVLKPFNPMTLADEIRSILGA